MNFLGKELIPRKSVSIVAEISCNPISSKYAAMELIRDAKHAGCDAVKLQTYKADEMTIDSGSIDFICKEGPWKGRNLYELYLKNEMDFNALIELFKCANNVGIPIFSSVFGARSLAALKGLVDCPVYKIASFEANDPNFVRDVCALGKPVLISTGCIGQYEIRQIKNRYDNVIFMHCVSKYPHDLGDANLARIDELKKLSDIFGYSDHTTTSVAAQIAITMGATIIEKHFKGEMSGSDDDSFSLNTNAMRNYVRDCREACQSVNMAVYETKYQRSLYIVKNMREGEVFTRDNIRSIRPGYGAHPSMLKDVIGQTINQDASAGTPLTLEMVGPGERDVVRIQDEIK